jgi:glycosyltransferase involved in cell wall biosynthesis
VTQASLDLYRARYPDVAQRLLPNGFDEDDFAGLAAPAKRAGELRLLHVGSLKGGRSPLPVFRAMKELAARDAKYARIAFSLVGTHHREHVAAAEGIGLNGQVAWAGREPRRDVVRRMGESDALVLFPSQDAPTAIPGKTYEYLRAGRPVLVVSAPNETTRFLEGKGPVVKAPDDVAGIAAVLADWFDRADPPAPEARDVARYARDRLAGELGAVLEGVAC